jgi:hypothetical protein
MYLDVHMYSVRVNWYLNMIEICVHVYMQEYSCGFSTPRIHLCTRRHIHQKMQGYLQAHDQYEVIATKKEERAVSN